MKFLSKWVSLEQCHKFMKTIAKLLELIFGLLSYPLYFLDMVSRWFVCFYTEYLISEKMCVLGTKTKKISVKEGFLLRQNCKSYGKSYLLKITYSQNVWKKIKIIKCFLFFLNCLKNKFAFLRPKHTVFFI